jgi:transposase
MKYYAGLDVSLEQTSVCLMKNDGEIVRELKITSDPESLVTFFKSQAVAPSRIGLEAGPLSQWLHAGLTAAGYETVLLETRHVKAALSAMTVKTDRKDARGIAHLLRLGWYRPVHAKSFTAREVRALLVARKVLHGKLVDIELSLRGILRGFGLKVGKLTRRHFEARVRDLSSGQPTLTQIVDSMLAAHKALLGEIGKLHKAILVIVRSDDVCRRLMTVPGVGPLAAITFKSAIDDPSRFRKSRSVGAHLGLTPRKYQSGETDVTGQITRVGDVMTRTALYEAANAMLTRTTRFSALKVWAMNVARRRGNKRAKVALARRLATVLHRMWVDGTTFCWTKTEAIAAT